MQKRNIAKQINNTIFTKDDILRLIDFVYSEWKNSKSLHKSFNITLNSEDNETLDFVDQEIEQLALDENKIVKINISFIDYRDDQNNIQISLKQGNTYYEYSEYKLSSCNSMWLNDSRARLKKIFESFTPQNTFFSNSRKTIYFLLPSFFGVFLFRLILIIYKPGRIDYQIFDAHPLAMYSWVVFFIYSLGGMVFFLSLPVLKKYVFDLWPSIEFDFGPEHKKNQKKRRKTMAYIFTSIAIPFAFLILSLLFT
jgi:hypothetical protein